MSDKSAASSSNGATRVELVKKPFMLPKPIPATPKK